MVIIALQPVLVHVPALETGGAFESLVAFGQHIGTKNIGVSVVVNVRHISAHARQTNVRHRLGKLLGEAAFLVVYVQIIPLKKVI